MRIFHVHMMLMLLLCVSIKADGIIRFHVDPRLNQLVGKSVAIAGNYYFSSIPGNNTIIGFQNPDSPVFIAPLTVQENAFNHSFVMVADENSQNKIVVCVSIPEHWILVYHLENNRLVLNKNFSLEQYQGFKIAMSGDWLAFTDDGDTDNAFIHVVNLLNATRTIIQENKIDDNAHYGFSLEIKYVSNDGLYVVSGNPVLDGKGNASAYIYYSKIISENLNFINVYNRTVNEHHLYGSSVAISSNAKRILIGCPTKYIKSPDNKEKPTGYVSILESDIKNNWEENYRINGSDYVFFNYFGIKVALSKEKDQDTLVIGALSFQYQLRNFIYKRDNNDWSLFYMYQTDRSLTFEDIYWANETLLINGNYSLAINDKNMFIGVTNYSSLPEYFNVGAIFVASLTVAPMESWLIALIAAGITVLCAAIFGVIYAIIEKRRRRDDAYEEVIN